MHRTLVALSIFVLPVLSAADEPRFVWPDRAPGETSLAVGTAQPARPGEDPPVTRVVGIRRPTIDVFPAKSPNGTAVLVLPGGGFAKVVPDKEGSEVAPLLNRMGIDVHVLRYRTSERTPAGQPLWQRPLQDAQRAMRLIRAEATTRDDLVADRIGVLAFSAGGQVGAILHTATEAAYEPLDAVDEHSFRPDFSLLIYPWRVLDEKSNELLPEIRITEKSPPAFLVHTHDDRSSSLGSVLIYADLKRHGVPAELHVYENGGHGYGARPVPNSNIGTWPDRAAEWLIRRGLARSEHD